MKKFSMMQEELRSVASDRTELSSTDHIADVGKMVGKTDPSTEQESQEELWDCLLLELEIIRYLSERTIPTLMNKFTITRKP